MTEAQIVEWVEAYPGVDIQQELRNMRQWCKHNPTKRKTSRGIGKFDHRMARQSTGPRRWCWAAYEANA